MTKAELRRREDAAWAELLPLLRSLAPARLEEPGYSPDGGSVKDLMAHIAGWQAAAARALHQIRNGTYAGGGAGVEELNRRFLQAGRNAPLPVVWEQLLAARTRMRAAMNDLQTVPREAVEWFEESGATHYHAHLGRLREWAGELPARFHGSVQHGP